jgi:quercetin dioxygenase-like cupin family protein
MTADEPRVRGAGGHLSGLLAEIVSLYRTTAAGPPAATLSRAILVLDQLTPPWMLSPRRSLPVCRFLPVALRRADAGPLAALAQAVAQAEPSLDWLQNPNYTAARMGAGFVDRYGYVELVGPGRPFHSTQLLVGFLLLGPETHYPDHAHAAEETYHVVSGSAEWWREGRDWQREPAGAVIHHAPHVRHAMRTQDEPLLALYCWTGEVATPADLTREA